ncbi:MAG: thermonuclease family protein [Alphaproteobacteria bacterium]|nr:thermonuclease family protein [Alphaproteobacteria bacterium]
MYDVNMKIFYVIICSFLLIIPAKAKLKIGAEIDGKVWVIDGDSLRISSNDFKKYEVRIFGVNAPELNTKKGKIAKTFMIKLIKKGNRKVSCKVIDIDRYKRYVSVCHNNQGDLAEIMLKNKQAKVLTRYLHLAPQEIQDRYNKYK